MGGLSVRRDKQIACRQSAAATDKSRLTVADVFGGIRHEAELD